MFDILATIVGHIDHQTEAERLARELHAVVVKARTLGCVVEIRDVRLSREVQRLMALPQNKLPPEPY